MATFVSQASLPVDWPRVMVGVAVHHHTWELIDKSEAFGLHLITEKQVDWAWNFGLSSGKNRDKLQGLNCGVRASGSPILWDAAAWMDCRVEQRMETGDRTIFLGEVLDASPAPTTPVLTAPRLFELATPEQLQQLQTSWEADSFTDAQAIEQWRAKQAKK